MSSDHVSAAARATVLQPRAAAPFGPVKLAMACCASLISLAVATPGYAEMTPAGTGQTGLPADLMQVGPRCLPGFNLKLERTSFTCTSAPIRCDRKFPLGDGARVEGDRFVYGCSKVPT